MKVMCYCTRTSCEAELVEVQGTELLIHCVTFNREVRATPGLRALAVTGHPEETVNIETRKQFEAEMKRRRSVVTAQESRLRMLKEGFNEWYDAVTERLRAEGK